MTVAAVLCCELGSFWSELKISVLPSFGSSFDFIVHHTACGVLFFFPWQLVSKKWDTTWDRQKTEAMVTSRQSEGKLIFFSPRLYLNWKIERDREPCQLGLTIFCWYSKEPRADVLILLCGELWNLDSFEVSKKRFKKKKREKLVKKRHRGESWGQEALIESWTLWV